MSLNQLLLLFQRDMELFVITLDYFFGTGMLTECFEDQITVSQLHCLRFVLLNGDVTIGEVAVGLGISYPAATKAISRLEEKKLVFRRQDTDDRRNIVVNITEEGRLLARGIRHLQHSRLEELVKRMEPEELEALMIGMNSFLKAALDERGLSRRICLHCGREHRVDCQVERAGRKRTESNQ